MNEDLQYLVSNEGIAERGDLFLPNLLVVVYLDGEVHEFSTFSFSTDMNDFSHFKVIK